MTAEEVIKRIEQYSGNIAAVARSYNLTRQAVYNFINAHPTVKKALAQTRETAIDNVESVLLSCAMNGQPWAVCFYLKTQAKHRGYVERSQIEIPADQEIVVKIEREADQ